jgi:hypothetical protein
VSGLWLKLERGLDAPNDRNDEIRSMTTPDENASERQESVKCQNKRCAKRPKLENKTLTVKQGNTRIDSKRRKCGALNRVSAAQGEVRVPYVCKECGEKQRTF